MNNELLIFIPTYNEKENVEKIFNDISALNISADLLFMDDNSPDGTGEVLEQMAKVNRNVKVIHRASKLGVGSAHVKGISYAYDNGYKILITMDCDFTHIPANIIDFLKYAPQYDIVLGSRYMAEDSLEEWRYTRKFLTNLGHFATVMLLNMPYDATGAFRLYRLDKIGRHCFKKVKSRGYSFFFESLFILCLNKYSVKELPIRLPKRTYGHSKMKYKDVFISISQLLRLFLKKLFYRKYFLATGPDSLSIDVDHWNQYWAEKEGKGARLYDIVASFYREYIIKRMLNKFVKRHFSQGAKVLHAGCGGGQVDADIGNYLNICALDISVEALKLYRKHNRDHGEVIQGDIFNIPSENKNFDGIYNLGVMEHFTEPEILKILREFQRVLRDDGKLLIFWPPKFGLSVMFLNSLHYLLNKILRRDVRLHPDEPSPVESRQQVQFLFEEANFKTIDYYFGFQDLFTYTIIVAVKTK